MRTSDDLCAILFKTIEGLTDKENPIELARARAVADVAQVIVNVGKLEVDYARATKRPLQSGFLIAGEVCQEAQKEEQESLPKPKPPEEELEIVDEAQQPIQDMPDDLYLTGYRVKGIVRHKL